MSRSLLPIHISRWPIQAQLIYLLMVVLVPVFVALGWYFADERERARERAAAEVAHSADRVKAAIARYLSEQELGLSRLAARPLVRAQDARQCDLQLLEYVNLRPETGNLLQADLQGRVICSATSFRTPPSTTASRLWWSRVAQSEGFVVGNGMASSMSGRWIVLLSYPIRDGEGVPSGALVQSINLEAVNARLMQPSAIQVLTELADETGIVIGRSHDAARHIGRTTIEPAPPDTDAAAAPGIAATLFGAGETPRLRVRTPIPGTPWVLQTSMSDAQALAGTTATRNRVIMASLALLAIGLLLAWRISLRIVRPIEALSLVARRVASGEQLSTPATEEASQAPAEIHSATRQIDSMLLARAKHEAALASREQMFRSLFHNNPVPHLLQKAHAEIVDVNDALLQASGYTREELVGAKVSEIGLWGTPRDMERAREALLLHGRLDGFEGTGRLRSGEQRTVLLTTRSLQIDGEPHFLHSIMDITERRRAEEISREREERLRFLLSRTSAVIYTSRAYGDFGATFVSDSVERLLGYTPGEFLAIPAFWSSHLHPEDVERFFAAKPRLIEEGYLVLEYRFRRRDGEYRWIRDEIQLYRDGQGEPAELIGFWVDVTERHEAERQVRENEARFRTLTALSSDWYWEQDAQFRFVRSSLDESQPGAEEAPVGQTHWDTVALNLTEKDWAEHRALLLAHQQFRDFEICRIDRNQRVRWISVSGTPIIDEQGRFGGYRGVGRDITAQKQAAEKIYQLAFFDSLTGLPNRRRLMEQLRRSLLLAARNQAFGAILFIDLDNFKSLNDTQGHDVGDLLLQQVALRLSSCVRGIDTVARLGGDEFVVLLDDLRAPSSEAVAQAEVVGHKILQTLGRPYDLNGREHRSTPSIGITLFGDSVGNVDDLLKQADLAMYQAKNSGRNTLRFFDVAMQASVDRRVALEAELRVALARGELELHYQPVVRANGRVVGAEALVRWRSPTRGMVSPGEFIPVAESSGLILPLGRWVLETACAQLVRWGTDPAYDGMTLSVNVSAQQFREAGFVQQVLDVLQASGVSPAGLKFELTESLLAHNLEDVIAKMGAIKAHGVGFSLDDFGTGYSSLSYLKRLPLDQIKIDQSFVQDVLTDPSDAAIARTIIALGESLQLHVVAEGVESEGQLAFLAAQRCHAFQGYLFSRPVPAEDFAAFVARRQVQAA